MASERYIDLQLIKPLTKSSGIKGKIALTNLFKEYFNKLNVGYLDPCCPEGSAGAAGCPAISADPNNAIQCRSDGLYTENDFVSVFDFGAVGDGVTDDTVNIQEALDSGAKTILFPQGTYNITTQLKVKSNTTLFGYGATIFRAAAIDNLMINDSNGSLGVYGANSNISVYGLAFNGNRANFASNATLLVFGHTSGVNIKDCEFYNIPGSWHGTELNAVEHAIVDGCIYHDGPSSPEMLQIDLARDTGVFPWFGPYDNTPCKDVLITNCLFYNGRGGTGSHSSVANVFHTNITISNNIFRNLSGGIALPILEYRNLKIIGNLIDGANIGIYATGAANPLKENWIISNNQFLNMTQAFPAVHIRFVNGLVFTNNNIETTVNEGMSLLSCSGFNISNNTLRDINTSTTVDSALMLFTSCDNGVISGNIGYKSAAGFVTGTKTIDIITGGANVTIENNTLGAVASTTTFTNFAATSAIVGTNTINGTITPATSTKTTNYTYLPTDSVLNVDTTAGNVTITINPAIFNKQGLIVKKTSVDVNTVTITPSSGTINGVASIVLTAQNHIANIKSDWVNLQAIMVLSLA